MDFPTVKSFVAAKRKLGELGALGVLASCTLHAPSAVGLSQHSQIVALLLQLLSRAPTKETSRVSTSVAGPRKTVTTAPQFHTD